MALRSVATTDTINTFRTTFNSLASDVGDLSNLNGSETSSIVAAINEALAATSSFTLRDSSSTTQAISGGDTLNVVGVSNETTVVVSPTDTLTIGLESDISGLNSLTATTLTGGSVELSGHSVRTSDSSVLQVNDSITVSNSGAVSGVTTLSATTDVTINNVSVATKPFAIAQAIALG
jgi:hypothetical protein